MAGGIKRLGAEGVGDEPEQGSRLGGSDPRGSLHTGIVARVNDFTRDADLRTLLTPEATLNIPVFSSAMTR